ncbi:ATP-binding protein, partial [Alistipes putredinis]|uniref:ATP-binding protein n=1 Tax=Alistipes putredinis TaxID=28117 RepID=UPI003AB50FEA
MKKKELNDKGEISIDWINESLITFADTGCGISEKALPHIFDPFYQDPATTSRDRHNHGTGIGLALSRG